MKVLKAMEMGDRECDRGHKSVGDQLVIGGAFLGMCHLGDVLTGMAALFLKIPISVSSK